MSLEDKTKKDKDGPTSFDELCALGGLILTGAALYGVYRLLEGKEERRQDADYATPIRPDYTSPSRQIESRHVDYDEDDYDNEDEEEDEDDEDDDDEEEDLEVREVRVYSSVTGRDVTDEWYYVTEEGNVYDAGDDLP